MASILKAVSGWWYKDQALFDEVAMFAIDVIGHRQPEAVLKAHYQDLAARVNATWDARKDGMQDALFQIEAAHDWAAKDAAPLRRVADEKEAPLAARGARAVAPRPVVGNNVDRFATRVE